MEAVIFDMDGLLIDSEPFWQQGEINVFSKVGIDLTETMCLQTIGLRLDEAVKHWYQFKPWDSRSLQDIEQEILDEVSSLILQKGQAMEGVYEVLELFKVHDIKIGLASSSPSHLIEAVVKKLEIDGYFDTLVSAEHEKYGKPHPAVFLSAAEQLEVSPTNCLVFEDSFNGLIAAKAARMKAVVIPQQEEFDQQRFSIADIKLRSLREFDLGLL